MGKSSKAPRMQVTEYSMSLHLGLCAYGEGIEVLAIYFGEKLAWRGRLQKEGSAYINKPNLFGGIKKEGGVKGHAYFLPGGPMQTVPTSLAERLGKTRETCPGFRGLASLFFVGTAATDGGWSPVPGTGGSGAGGGSGGGSGSGWTPPGGGLIEPDPGFIDPDLIWDWD